MIFVADIQRVVAAHFNIPASEMTSDRKARRISRPRQVAMYFARELTHHSFPSIGRMFGHRDHTTVMHAVRTIGVLKDFDREMHESVNAIKEQLLAENSQKQTNFQANFYGVELAA
jgi:chromosomal replication initiator protein